MTRSDEFWVGRRVLEPRYRNMQYLNLRLGQLPLNILSKNLQDFENLQKTFWISKISNNLGIYSESNHFEPLTRVGKGARYPGSLYILSFATDYHKLSFSVERKA